MSIAAYVALARDGIILAALAFIIWFIYHAGQNADLKADMAALQKQLLVNSQQEARYATEAKDAELQRQADMQSALAAINSHANSPVRLCRNAGGSSVPGTATASAGRVTSAGGSDAGLGEDLRPAITALELKYEGYLASCRAVLTSWPK